MQKKRPKNGANWPPQQRICIDSPQVLHVQQMYSIAYAIDLLTGT